MPHKSGLHANSARHGAPIAGAVVLILLSWYAIAVGFNGFSRDASFMKPANVWLKQIGLTLGMMAALLIMLQFILTARLAWLDKLWGLNRLYRLHKWLGIAAAALASLHPFFLYLTPYYDMGKLSISQWPVLLGAAVLILLWVVLVTTLGRIFLEIPYHHWRKIHWLGFVLCIGVTLHTLSAGTTIQEPWAKTIWLILFAGYAACFVGTRLVRPAMLKSQRLTITHVEKRNHNVIEVRLRRPTNTAFSFYAGQYAMVTFYAQGIAKETHPFTLSSAPSPPKEITLTIKQCGDFTQTLDVLKPGDTAALEGGYGQFSYRLYPTARRVFIAGGIGITPMLSMLQDLALASDANPATLIWSNHTSADAFAAEFLVKLAAQWPCLLVHHVRTRQPDWTEEKGRIDLAMLQRLLLPEDRHAVYFLCGPPEMMTQMKKILKEMNVPGSRIVTEDFCF